MFSDMLNKKLIRFHKILNIPVEKLGRCSSKHRRSERTCKKSNKRIFKYLDAIRNSNTTLTSEITDYKTREDTPKSCCNVINNAGCV